MLEIDAFLVRAYASISNHPGFVQKLGIDGRPFAAMQSTHATKITAEDQANSSGHGHRK
jgi:hypothetical protein